MLFRSQDSNDEDRYDELDTRNEEDESSDSGSIRTSESTYEIRARWPSDYSTVSIVKAFRACAAATTQRKSVQQVFSQMFPGVPFRHTTFYRNRESWNRADSDTRRRFLSYGETEPGRWKHFKKAVRHLNTKSDLENARRRAKKGKWKDNVKVEALEQFDEYDEDDDEEDDYQ